MRRFLQVKSYVECTPYLERRRKPATPAKPMATRTQAAGSGISNELTRSDGTPPGPCENHCPFWKLVRVAFPPRAPVLFGPQVAIVPGKFTEAMIQ